MAFLNACRTFRGYANVDIILEQQLGDLATAFAGQCHDAQIVVVRRVNGLDDIGLSLIHI